MKFEIKKLSNSQKEIKVRLEFSEIEPFVEEEIKELEIKGFRKGKAPEEIAKSFSKEKKILDKAASKAVKHYYLKILKEENIEPIGLPEIQITKIAWNNPLEFKIKLWVMPKIQLPDYKKIASEVKRREIFVEKKEVEDTIRWIQKSRAKTLPKNEPSQAGDFVEIVFSSPQVNKGKEQKERFILGESYLLPEFEKNLLGMRVGQEKEFTVIFPKNYIDQKLAGKEIKFTVKILKVEKVELPKIDDDWAKSLGNFKSLKDLEESVKEGIKKEKEKIESQRVQAEILEKIAKESSCEIPQLLVDIETEKTIEDLKKRIPQMLGMSFDDYLKNLKQTEEEFRKSLLPEIKTKIKKFLVLREIKNKEGIQASEEEIKEGADKFLSQFRTPEEAERYIDPETLREYTKERIENQKTLRFLESFAK
jgi:trigger factor